MIEINLIEEKKALKLPVVLGMDLNEIPFKKIFVIYLLAVGVENYMESTYEKNIKSKKEEISKLDGYVKKLNKELKQNRGLRVELEKFNQQIDQLKERSVQVEKIIQTRSNPRRILESLARSIPEDVWLTKLEIGEDKRVNLEGMSIDYKNIGQFISNSNNSIFFSNSMGLQDSKTEEKIFDGVNVRVESFKIQASITNFGNL